MARLWQRMAEVYGHKWVSSYGQGVSDDGELTDVAQTWAKGLSGVTPEQFARGLEHCVKSGEAWPPTLPEFRQFCFGTQINEFGLNYIPEYCRPQPERRRERLLSSDEREAKRKNLSENMSVLKRTIEKHRTAVLTTETEKVKPFVSEPEKRKNIINELKKMGVRLPK